MPEADPVQERIRARLKELESQGLLRSLRSPAGIDLCSNDYLGLAQHTLLKERMAEAVMREGCGSTGSRLLRGERESFVEIEEAFASFKGTEKSLYFSTGYVANISVLTTFPEAGDVIYSDERNHASLIDGIRLSRARCEIFPHNDVAALARMMQADSSKGQKFVVIESLFSMDGDITPLAEYAALCRSQNAALIIDEAHAVGIYGERGTGLIEEYHIEDAVFLSINTAGKALGVSGAFVNGSAMAIDYLVQRARPFIFSTAPPPSVATALRASLQVIHSEPERRKQMRRRAAYLRRQLAEHSIAVPAGISQIIPVMIGGNEETVAVAHDLQQAGFDVRAIRPPSVAIGTARLRLSVNSNLSEPILDDFVAALAFALRKLSICAASS